MLLLPADVQRRGEFERQLHGICDVAWIKATAAAGAVSIEVEPSNELKSRSGIVTVAHPKVLSR